MARTRVARLALLDTHVVCWLYAGRIDLLSARAERLVESAQIAVSPIVRLEQLQYLFEIKRIMRRADRILKALAADIGHAQLIRAAFVTRDELIRTRLAAAVC
jgi:PIN domain nuclease of toxin-antitoxin system